MMRNARLLVPFLSLLLLSACGGSDDSAPTDKATISASCYSEKLGECVDYVWLWAEFEENFKTTVCGSEAMAGVWSSTPCDRTGMLGGCMKEVASFKQIVWLKSSKYDLTQKENCLAISGQEWVEP